MTQSGETGGARAMEIWLLPFAAMFTQRSRLNRTLSCFCPNNLIHRES
jgi:hypothetical protein